MHKFNEVAQTVLKEAQTDSSPSNIYREISDLLSKKGFRAFEQTEILDVVQKAIKMAYDEGYKAAESNPFR